MYTFLLILHLLICLSLIGVVLVQSGKGGGLAGGAFGGSAQTVFGGRGATDFFTKATMTLGGAFFLTSLVLALMSSGNIGGGQRSLIQTEAQRGAATTPAPATGAAPQTGQRPSAPATGTTPATGTGAPTPTPAPAGGR